MRYHRLSFYSVIRYALGQYSHNSRLHPIVYLDVCLSVEVPGNLDAPEAGVSELIECGGRQVHVARAAARAEIPDYRGSRFALI